MTPDEVLGCSPAVVLVTENVTVQFPFAGMVIPEKLKEVAPADKTFDEAPTHVPPAAPPTAVIFDRLSVNEALVKAMLVLLLKSVSVTVELPPEGIEEGENAFEIVGGAMTVKLAVAAVPALLLEVVTVLVVLVFTPAVAPLTVTLNWQFAPAARDGFVNEITFAEIEYEPSAQTVAAPVSTAVTPAGRLSVKASVLSAKVVFEFVKVNCKVEVEFN